MKKTHRPIHHHKPHRPLIRHLNKKLFDWGFTLLELLIVIAIIGILGSVMLTSFSTARSMARDSQRVFNIKQIANALDAYVLDNNVPPGEDGIEYINGAPDWIPGLSPTYIPIVPSDPIDAGMYKFHYTRSGNNYEVVSLLENNNNEAACRDGGTSCQYYEKASGDYLTLVNSGESGWKFQATSETYPPQTGSETPPITNSEPDTVPPSVPTETTATALSASTIVISWLGSIDTGSSDIAASGYRVYRNNQLIDSVISNPALSDAKQTLFTTSDTFLDPSTSYTYYVEAYDSKGNVSEPSLSSSAMTRTIELSH